MNAKQQADDEVESLADFDADSALADRLERERVDAERRLQVRELKRLTSAENHRQDALRIIREHVPLLKVPQLAKEPKPRKERPTHTWVLILSDWQLGQRDKLEATGQMFEQTSELTEMQVHALWDKVCRLHDRDRQSVDVSELVVEVLGDIVEGDQMRVSQSANVDQLVTQQTVHAFDLLSWLLSNALRRFPKVTVDMVGGNHDRVSTKPGNAGLGELGYIDTYSWLLGAFLQRSFSKAIDAGRMEIVNHESWFGTRVIAGQRTVFEHGASFRSSTGSYGGVSFYSIANAASGYQRMLDGADLVLMGHHHKAMVLPLGNGWGWQVMNGALPPSSGYAQSNFKGFGRPSQTLLDLHPKRGLVSWQPLYLEHDHMMRPGEFWELKRAA